MSASANYKFLPASLADSLGDCGLAVRRPVPGGFQGLHRSRHHGSSVEFADYRVYTPGDPPHLIDWQVYARSDRYLIRRHEEEANLRAQVLLDVSDSQGFRSEGGISKYDYAATLAAGLLYVLIRQGDTGGLMTFDHEVRQTFPPTGTFAGLRPILLGLEAVVPAGRSDIPAVLHQTAAALKSRGVVVVISDLLHDAREILAGVHHLQHEGHQVALFHIMDRAEVTLPFQGLAEVRDLETGQRMILELDELRDAYLKQVEAHCDELRRSCAACQATYHRVETNMPVDHVLRMEAAHL